MARKHRRPTPKKGAGPVIDHAFEGVAPRAKPLSSDTGPHTGWVAPEESFAVKGVEVPWSILDADRSSTLEGR